MDITTSTVGNLKMYCRHEFHVLKSKSMVMNRIHTPGIFKTSTELVSCHDWAAWAVQANTAPNATALLATLRNCCN